MHSKKRENRSKYRIWSGRLRAKNSVFDLQYTTRVGNAWNDETKNLAKTPYLPAYIVFNNTNKRKFLKKSGTSKISAQNSMNCELKVSQRVAERE